MVLVGAVGVAFGAQWADAVVGLVITAAIVIVGYRAARSVGHRLLDAVDPVIVRRISTVVGAVDGVKTVTEVRLAGPGIGSWPEVRLSVDGGLSVTMAHEIAEVAHHELLHQVPISLKRSSMSIHRGQASTLMLRPAIIRATARPRQVSARCRCGAGNDHPPEAGFDRFRPPR